jgi:hypothetical protein
VRRNLALVGFADKETLLALADAIALGAGAVIDAGLPGIGGVVEDKRASFSQASKRL